MHGCEELTQWKRPWCWERLKAGEGDDWGWDGWMASLNQRTWVWASSRSWWLTGKHGVLQSMGSHRVGHDWVTELNWHQVFICTQNKATSLYKWKDSDKKYDMIKYDSLQRGRGFPGGSESREFTYNLGGPGFNPWVGKILWRT